MPRLSRRLALASAAAASLSPRGAQAGPRLVRLGQADGVKTPRGLGCRVFAAAVAAHPALGDAVRVVVYDDSALGDELLMVQGALDGTVDAVLCSTGVISNVVPELGLLDAAFLFKDARAARDALDGEIGVELARLAQAKRINVLAWAENGLRHMTANRPIRTPADLAGLKLRVPQSDVALSSFRALGASPAALPFPALYEALRTGEFEAEENPLANIESGRLFDVQKYLCLTRHIYSAAAFVVSQDLLDDLTPEQQAALAACGVSGGVATRVAADAAERDGVARLRDAGMTVITDIDMAAFIAKARPNLAALGQKYGAELMARLIQAGS